MSDGEIVTVGSKTWRLSSQRPLSEYSLPTKFAATALSRIVSRRISGVSILVHPAADGSAFSIKIFASDDQRDHVNELAFAFCDGYCTAASER